MKPVNRRKIKVSLITFALVSLSLLALPCPVKASAYEDFTTYEEIDPNNHIARVGTDHIDSTLKRNDDNSSLFKDYGTDYFENFTHYLDIRVNKKDNSDLAFLWALSNDLDDWRGLWDNNKTALGVGAYDSWDNPFTLSIREVYNETQNKDEWTSAQIDTWYYLIIRKNGASFTMQVFTDSGRTVSAYNLSLTLQANHKFKFVFGCMSYNDNNSPQVDHDIEKLALASPMREITFYFTDYGVFWLNRTSFNNGTSFIYTYGDVIEFSALPFNATCLFLNFTFGASFNDTNPYNYTVTENTTVWCIFEDPPYGKLAPPITVNTPVLFCGGLMLFGVIVATMYVALSKKK